MLGPTTRFLLRHLLTVFWLGVTALPLVVFVWLVRPHMPGADLLGLVLAFAWIFGSWWLGETTARRMAEENDLFLTALRHTLRDVRQRLALLPVVGQWFESATDKDDDERND
jgi:hypothetical protein